MVRGAELELAALELEELPARSGYVPEKPLWRSRDSRRVFRKDFRVAALVGHLATDNDAARLARSQAPVKQICTGTICHLDAAAAHRNIESVRPGIPIFESSVKTKTGLDEVLIWMKSFAVQDIHCARAQEPPR